MPVKIFLFFSLLVISFHAQAQNIFKFGFGNGKNVKGYTKVTANTMFNYQLGYGFDQSFYYYRPTSAYAAHGYGPVLLASAEMITLLKQHVFEMNDSALQLKD